MKTKHNKILRLKENLIRKDDVHFKKPKYFIIGMHHLGNMIDFSISGSV